MSKLATTPDLSNDAKAVMGCFFGFSITQKLVFQLVQARPTPRMQKALDELVAADLIVRTKLPRADKTFGVEYKAKVDGRPYQKFIKAADHFEITEPIT